MTEVPEEQLRIAELEYLNANLEARLFDCKRENERITFLLLEREMERERNEKC